MIILIKVNSFCPVFAWWTKQPEFYSLEERKKMYPVSDVISCREAQVQYCIFLQANWFKFGKYVKSLVKLPLVKGLHNTFKSSSQFESVAIDTVQSVVLLLWI